MSKGTVNKVILIGNLGRDPEMRYAPNGLAVATLSIATTETWKDKASGENQDRTEWHRVVLFARLGEIAGEYLRKGSKVFIEGQIQTRKWQDKTSGQDRYMTEIVANRLEMLSPRIGTEQSGGGMGDSSFEKSLPEPSSEPMPEPMGIPEHFSNEVPF